MDKIIIYQVLPRLFGNQKKKLVENGDMAQNGCGKLDDFTDERLRDIKELGATHIWYTGVIEHATQTSYEKFGIRKDHPAVVKGKAGSPYAIKDYYDIDPDLATKVENRKKEFANLVKRTHKAGLKVIMDFVPNHVARQYFSDAKPKGVRDLGEDDVKEVFFSNQNNFYYLVDQPFAGHMDLYAGEKEPYTEMPCKVTGNDFFSNNPGIYEWYETVKLNYGIDYRNGHSRDFLPRPNTWLKMCDILLYWCGMGIDGFRCDMAEMVPVEFWNWVIPTVKEKFPEVIFIAETYDPAQYRGFIYDGKFDYLYDKVGLYDTLRGIMCNENSCHSITGCWQKLSGIEPNMLNFLENHDEQRIASDFFAADALKGRPAMAVSACINKGPVMLYFGQELGEKAMDKAGFSGMDGRTTIFDYWAVPTVQRWLNGKLTKEERNLRAYYASLLNICRNEKAISEGSFFDLTYANFNNPDYNTNKQYAFFRKHENECLLIVVNFENNAVKLKINIPQHAFDVLQIPEDDKLVTFTDLLSGKRFKQKMSCNSPFGVDVEQNDSVVLKFVL